MSRIESLGDAHQTRLEDDQDKWRKQKLLDTVKKSDLLDGQQATEFEMFLMSHHEVFSLEEGERGETSLTEMTIDTGDSLPQ